MSSEPGEGTYVFTLSNELLKVAQSELHEDPARRAEDIEAIRKWIKQQPHLNIKTDDMTILRFLRHAKFSLERAKERIDTFYTLRNALPEWFGARNIRDPKPEKLIKLGFCAPLKGYDKNGRKVILFRSGLTDPKEFTFDDMMRANQIIFEVLLMDEVTSIAGIEAINDLTGITLAHFTMNFSVMKKCIALFEATPARFKGMHYWKPPSIFEKFFNIFKSLMKDKMKRRLHVHGSDLKSLHAHIPVEMLPEEYGGTGGKIADLAADFAKEVFTYEKHFLEEAKYSVDESKRLGKPKSHEDLFGIDGSFRKLEID